MTRSKETFELRVSSGGDPLRMERLTESLKDSLAQVKGVTVAPKHGDAPPGPGEKGGSLSDVALLVAIAYGSRATAHVLVTTIREWASRERHRQVQVTKGTGGISVEINGSSEQTQQEIIDRMFGADGDCS